MGGGSFAVGVPQVFWRALGYLRILAMRAGPGGVIALAVAGAGVFWMLRGNRQRPQRLMSRGPGEREGRSALMSRAGGGAGEGMGRGSRGGARAVARAGSGIGIGGVFRGVRKVTVGMEGGVGEEVSVFHVAKTEEGREGDGERKRGRLELREDVGECLSKLGKMADVYLVVRVQEDEQEVDVMKALERAELFAKAGGLCRDKVVFCETVPGRVSVVRQIEPQLHIDSSVQVVAALQRFIKYVTLIAPRAEEVVMPKNSNVHRYSSFKAFIEQSLAKKAV